MGAAPGERFDVVKPPLGLADQGVSHAPPPLLRGRVVSSGPLRLRPLGGRRKARTDTGAKRSRPPAGGGGPAGGRAALTGGINGRDEAVRRELPAGGTGALGVRARGGVRPLTPSVHPSADRPSPLTPAGPPPARTSRRGLPRTYDSACRRTGIAAGGRRPGRTPPGGRSARRPARRASSRTAPGRRTARPCRSTRTAGPPTAGRPP